jgi:hypothetical protein
MRRIVFVVAASILLPGCGMAKPVGPVIDTPPPARAAAPAAPRAGQCDAPQLAYLVGRSRNEIPAPVDGTRRRVACTHCPVTEDYRPDRTDIRYDAETGLVTSVKCG